MENSKLDQTKIARVVSYCRVSSVRQVEEGFSIESQKKRIRATAKAQGWILSEEDIFVDEGVSGGVQLWSRPAGRKMLQRLNEGGITHIVAVNMDRLFRDVRNLLTTVDELRGLDIHLHLLEYNGAALDTKSAIGRFFLTVVGGIAELERGQASERVKNSVRHLKSEFKPFTGAIYGWDRVNGDIVPNWEEQMYIDLMKELHYDMGLSGFFIADVMNTMGRKGKLGGKWRSSTVLRTIRYEFHNEIDKFEKPVWWGGYLN